MIGFFGAVGRQIASAFMTNVHFIAGHPLLVAVFTLCACGATYMACRVGR